MLLVILFSFFLVFRAVEFRELKIILLSLAAIAYSVVVLIANSPIFLEHLALLRVLEHLLFFILVGLFVIIAVYKEDPK